MSVPARTPTRLLTAILVEAGVLTEEQVQAGLALQRDNGLRIGETLVEMGAVREEDIGWALARQLGLPFLDVSLDAVDHDLVRSFGDTVLHRLQVLPLVRGENRLSVAFADPTDPEAVAEVEHLAGCPLDMGIATPTAIRAALDAVFGQRRDRVRETAPDTAPPNVLWDRTGSAFVAFHVRQALRAGATELHFVPAGGALLIQHRVGRQLVTHATEPASEIHNVLARLEALGVPVVNADRRWANARFEMDSAGRMVQVEASLLAGGDGIVAVLALTPCGTRTPALDTLGASPADVARIREALTSAEGVILVSAPPRSGGTTTLLALLDAINRDGRRVLYFGRRPPLPLPTGVHLTVAATPERGGWQTITRGLGADVVALDGLPPDALSELADIAGAGRLLVARIEAADAYPLLERLGRLENRDTLSERLRFVWHQRLASANGARNGAAAMGEDGRRPDRIAMIEVIHATDAVRAALQDGEPAARFREAAALDRGRPRKGR